ncbi:pyridoxal-phosphate dependent enzyme [Geothrix sp.]|jgi:cystathionine beta-synthase|uniref:pyridoxal-phosphate dependent enzyme n=1 Tax=Geothrix sp. TaxID=1962974 RepID=UPI0025C4023C|nr:pyridoxal-phosphate dependent enzyme [Geothrix sp.]
MAPCPAQSVLDLIGHTPLLRIGRIDTGPCELFLKLESQNPGGSIKDRVALAMTREAEREGRLRPGGVLVEATAGNTGLGLALVGRAKGYRVLLVVPDKMAEEKMIQLRALGAEIYLTRSDVGNEHPDYYQNVAARLAADIPGAFYTDQFTNPANPKAHEESTGPEILAQMGDNVDAVVCGVGSGGTLTGLTRCFQKHNRSVDMVLADPEGSVLVPWLQHGVMEQAGSWAVEGIGEDYLPPQADFTAVRRAYIISDEESFKAARGLLEAEGILAGSSTGTLLAAALRYCREQKAPKRVVTFVCDTGARYLSKVFNPSWTRRRGWGGPSRLGDLRDWVVRRFEDGTAASVSPGDSTRSALKRMEAAGLTVIPVLDGSGLVGAVEIRTLLAGGISDPAARTLPVSHWVSGELPWLDSGADLELLHDLALRNPMVFVIHEGRPYGFVTPLDLAFIPEAP